MGDIFAMCKHQHLEEEEKTKDAIYTLCKRTYFRRYKVNGFKTTIMVQNPNEKENYTAIL